MPFPPEPKLEHVADYAIDVSLTIELGDTGIGERRVSPITRGTVSGPRLGDRIPPTKRVLPNLFTL